MRAGGAATDRASGRPTAGPGVLGDGFAARSGIGPGHPLRCRSVPDAAGSAGTPAGHRRRAAAAAGLRAPVDPRRHDQRADGVLRELRGGRCLPRVPRPGNLCRHRRWPAAVSLRGHAQVRGRAVPGVLPAAGRGAGQGWVGLHPDPQQPSVRQPPRDRLRAAGTGRGHGARVGVADPGAHPVPRPGTKPV
ncbi:hypothetical protein D3C71_893430 [compost metagenome]